MPEPHRQERLEKARGAERRAEHKKWKREVAQWNLSSKLLAGIAGLWILATTLLLTVPEAHGLITYLHWVRWPPSRELTDLVAFRLPHARNIEVHTADGMLLKGWHVLPSHQVAAAASRFPLDSRAREEFFDEAMGRPDSRIVLYFHGNAATRGQFNRVELIKALAATMQAHVVTVDYRGFGDSTGWPSEEGLALDARALWAWVEERAGRGEGGAQVFLYGHSLGACVALELARHLPLVAALTPECSDAPDFSSFSPSSSNAKESAPAAPASLVARRPDAGDIQAGRQAKSVTPSGVILEAPFTNLSMAALYHPSALPFRLLPFFKHALILSMHERFPSLEYIQQVQQPIIILHGRRDRMIPFHLGEELYHTARLARLRERPETLEDVWFAEFSQAGHSNMYAYPQWTDELHTFMGSVEGAGNGKVVT